jgi:hypothetical protein
MPITIPAWPDPAIAAGVAFFAAARKFYALYRSAGFERPFAFGMMTMAEAESSFDPNALGDYVDEHGKKLAWSAHPVGTPTSYGAHQRKLDRMTQIQDGQVVNGKLIAPGLGYSIALLAIAGKNTIENEVRATLWELKTFPKAYGTAAIESAKTAYGVAYQATVTYERAGTLANGAAEKRGTMAETWVSLASGVWPRSRGSAPDGWEALTQGW